jgi:hypothetical protein
MRKSRFATVALIVFGLSAIAALAESAPRKRSVEMAITLPNGAAPRVIVPEGEGAIIRLPDRTRFGFVPMIRDDDDPSVVVVAIWDIDHVPNRRLGVVEVMIGGSAVASDTAPAFSIRIPRVIKPR